MAENLPTWIAQLSSGDVTQQAAAAEALARMGDDARPAAAALVACCGSSDSTVREWAAAALEELGPPPAGQIGELTKRANDKSVDVAYWAVTLLGRAGDDAAPAVATLAELLGGSVDPAVRERAAWALGKIGPAAAAARPALTEAAAGDDPRLQRLARKALESLAG